MIATVRTIAALMALALALATGALIRTAIAGAEPPIRIVALGDSLTAGFGVKPGGAFPEQLGRALAARGEAVEVINAGVSGDTTAGGLDRLEWALQPGTEAVIVELGANDGLRGQSTERARANLDAILAKLKARNIDVLLTGMRAPRSLGDAYANAFDRIFPELATKHGVLFYPFFLDGVALDPKLNQGDGIHPTEQGVAVIVTKIMPSVEELIARVKARRAAGGAPKG